MRYGMRFAVAAAVIGMLTLLPSETLASTTADRLLSIVPADAVSVGMVRVDDMRRSPTAQSIYSRMTAGGIDAEAERLLREAGLNPATDVDVIVFAVSPSTDPDRPRMLVAAGGRFDPARLGKVVEARGGIRRSRGGVTYFLAPEAETKPGEQPAVSLLDREIVLAGTEDAVVAAIDTLRRGENRFTSSILGRQMFRVDGRASGWLLFDVQRAQSLGSAKTPGASPFGDQAFAAVRNVSTISLWVAETSGALEFGSAAVAADAETRALLEDVLKGLLATLRVTAQEKQPEMVKVIRRFRVTSSGDTVSLHGSVPTAFVSEFAARVK